MRGDRLTVLLVLTGSALSGCGGGAGDASVVGPLASPSRPVAAVPDPVRTGTDSAARAADERDDGGVGRPPANDAPGTSRTQLSDPAGPTEDGVAAHGTKPIKPAGPLRKAGVAKRPVTARRQKALAPSPRRPCSLVTKSQARAIVGPVLEPIEAPQGPTCLYLYKSGTRSIDVTVQTESFSRMRERLKSVRAVSVGEQTGYCVSYGGPRLYLPVARGRLLTVSGPCRTATQFATKAQVRLGAPSRR